MLCMELNTGVAGFFSYLMKEYKHKQTSDREEISIRFHSSLAKRQTQ